MSGEDDFPDGSGVAITGLGVQCAIGNDIDEFTDALRRGASGISYEPSGSPEDELPAALGVRGRIRRAPAAVLERLTEVDADVLDRLRRLVRRASRSKQYSLLAAVEAWSQAGIQAGHDGSEVGVLVAGSNHGHQLSFEMSQKYQKSPSFVRPSYAHEFWDTDVLGAASEMLGIVGEGSSVGGASAAGNVGLVKAFQLIRSGAADACLVIAPITELSIVEMMAMWNLGALGGKSRQEPAEELSRPFDRQHEGFIYGEGAAALVLESYHHAATRGARALARVRGGVITLDGNHLTTPSVDGEVRVMNRALRSAGISAAQVDYVNAHATSTPLGDQAEAEGLGRVFGEYGDQPWVNSTKSMLGHCLGSASALEAVATVQQLRYGFVHPNVNLKEPIVDTLRLAPAHAVDEPLSCAINNGFGFGGINTCVVLGTGDED
ncbi:beta-ketoacyl-ACP synthase [Actinobacteria bacterium YIM 96077]|uniref:Beta-ketoacyl-ACP synthase n=1 Tax=Phytoactinopolyspora halophila TaxID=1981511 RepID=A0A329QEW9_9ACTN|nr:beta-ketoacyl synthase N-terminal-like domain-containing protein [Phytoactinopolyspora halophila]AYY14158.1 beta-ketoacyl-ACP synthase [Actinobacteria bacterium YIM 96077]RAW10249.1 beta-ketoacyl-ACP synthase [Phytoactinopolyspora halophila]